MRKKRPYELHEIGTQRKSWRGKVPVCVVFPNTYYIGMSNLAVHLLYDMLNKIPEVVCERVFFEEDHEVLSIESKKPLNSFELVFFTISFELDYINIVKMLKHSGIDVCAGKRSDKDPIIIGGGSLVMANPEPLWGFFDLFLLGDIESIIPDFMDEYLSIRRKKRDEIIEAMTSKKWVYNPRVLTVKYHRDGTIKEIIPSDFKVSIERYCGEGLAKSSIVTPFSEFSSMFLIEGTRGCPSRCPFCLIGNLYPFVFDKDPYIPDSIKDIGLIGGGISFHPNLKGIIDNYLKNGKTIHFPSMRIDKTPISIIELLKDQIKTLTFGIEAGSEHLRFLIGKPIKNEEILEKIDEIMEIKSFNLKLYFMVGLPDETKKDIESIVDLTKRIKHVMIKKGIKKKTVGNITVHVSPFVPKPATPYQRKPMEDMNNLKEKVMYLKHAFSKVDNVFLTHESIKFSFLQGVFARGDRRVSEIILRLSQGESLAKIIRENAINLNFYALRERDEKESLPWGFIFIP